MNTLQTQLTAQQPGEGPRNGGIARSATGKKGVKRRHDTKTFEVKYQAIMEVEKQQLQNCLKSRPQHCPCG